jgi:hypothetical protein
MAMNITDLTPVAMIILVAVIAISIGATVLTSIQGTQTVDASDYNITQAGLEALGTFGDFFPVIVIVAIAAVVIGLVWYFGRSTSTGM